MQRITSEDILCMQYAGMQAEQIMNIDEDAEEYAEAYADYIDRAEEVLSMQRRSGVVPLTFQEAGFPDSLKKIGRDCPPLIHCLGDLSLLAPDAVSIAIIGARAASPTGKAKAYELGRRLAEEGKVIVSGLALGCDKSAHEGCLDADGKTIAVVASGLNIVHPQENAPLQQRILDNGGLVLSEQPFGVKANPSRLVARKYRKRCFAVSYPKYSGINAGNELLIGHNLAKPI